MRVNPNLPLRERFHKCYVVDVSGCWLWCSTINNRGYGSIQHQGSTYGAHRISFLLHKGYLPSLQVNHHCDVSLCVNPEHLYEGTQKDNMRDRVDRGRWKGPRGRFGPKEIEAMRESSLTQRALARKYGISQPYVSRLLRGERGG